MPQLRIPHIDARPSRREQPSAARGALVLAAATIGAYLLLVAAFVLWTRLGVIGTIAVAAGARP